MIEDEARRSRFAVLRKFAVRELEERQVAAPPQDPRALAIEIDGTLFVCAQRLVEQRNDFAPDPCAEDDEEVRILVL